MGMKFMPLKRLPPQLRGWLRTLREWPQVQLQPSLPGNAEGLQRQSAQSIVAERDGERAEITAGFFYTSHDMGPVDNIYSPMLVFNALLINDILF
jgi:hypothetical protein